MRFKRSQEASKVRPVSSPLVCRWDLDKTYLLSEFDSLRELVKIPFERAEDKIAAPGVAMLIRQIRSVAELHGRPIRVYFVSASPPQIGRQIRKKLELDGIVYDGIVFKNQLQRIMRGKFRHLREQVGYKLTELLKMRVGLEPESEEYLFGDDWESDPLIYSLYADVVAGRVEAPLLLEILNTLRVEASLVDESIRLVRELKPADTVNRIFINLERRTPPAELRGMGRRLVPTYNYFQTAGCLYARGILDLDAVVRIAQELVNASAYTPTRLLNSIADLIRRGHLEASDAESIRNALCESNLVVAPRVPVPQRLLRWVSGLGSRSVRRRVSDAPAVPAIDYRAVIENRSVEEMPT